MKHTILDQATNELIAAAMEAEKALDRVFCVITNEWGEDSQEAKSILDGISDYKEALAPILGRSLVYNMGVKDTIKAE